MARNFDDWYYRATRPILALICLVACPYFAIAGLISGKMGGIALAYSGAPVSASSNPKTFAFFLVIHLALAAWCGWELFSLIFRGAWPGERPKNSRRGQRRPL